MRVAVRTAAKRDSEPEENEDNAAENVGTGRFAVSDGASTTARSEVWSRLLAEAYVKGDDPLAEATLAELRRAWSDRVYVPDLAWHAKEKLTRGSAATFLGLRVNASGYHMTAVGDSCLFHISDGVLVFVGPLTEWTQFSRFPELVHTTPDLPVPPEHVRSDSGTLHSGDVLLLTTDAIAKYLMRRHSETGKLPPILDHLGDAEQFAEFVERAREQGLDNDDSTVCVVWT